MKLSLTMLVAQEQLAVANALCAALGWGSDNFLVPLSASGMAPATHFGLRATDTAAFASIFQDAMAAEPGLASAMVLDLRDDDQRLGQFEVVIAERGLTRVESPVGV